MERQLCATALWIALLGSCATGCAGADETRVGRQRAAERVPLPETRPASLVIEATSGDGFAVAAGQPAQYRLTLAANRTSRLEVVHNGAGTSLIEFTATPADLDDLYRILRDAQLERIETREMEVHDRGGASVTVSWDEGGVRRRTVVHDAGVSFVTEESRARWARVVEALERLEREVVVRHGVELRIVLAPELAGRTLRIAASGLGMFEGTVPGAQGEEPGVVTVRVPPGTVPVAVAIQGSGEQTLLGFLGLDAGSVGEVRVAPGGAEGLELVAVPRSE